MAERNISRGGLTRNIGDPHRCGVKVVRRYTMKKEERDEREKRMGKTGKPDWYSFSSISWPLPDSKDSRHKGIHKTFAGDMELKENMTATYWG